MSTAAPRIEGVPDGSGNLAVRATFRETRKRLGHVVEPVRVLARRPALLAADVAMELAFERAHDVDERLKELAVLKVATMVGCEFCIDIGSKIVRDSGIPEAQVRGLAGYRESDAFDERERAVLDLAAGMTATPAHVPDDLWARLREHFDEPALVELVTMISWENFRARSNHAFGLASEGFGEGGVCALPERPAVAAPA